MSSADHQLRPVQLCSWTHDMLIIRFWHFWLDLWAISALTSIICFGQGFSASSLQLCLKLSFDSFASQLLIALFAAAFPVSPAPFQLSFILDLYASAWVSQHSTPWYDSASPADTALGSWQLSTQSKEILLLQSFMWFTYHTSSCRCFLGTLVLLAVVEQLLSAWWFILLLSLQILELFLVWFFPIIVEAGATLAACIVISYFLFVHSWQILAQASLCFESWNLVNLQIGIELCQDAAASVRLNSDCSRCFFRLQLQHLSSMQSWLYFWLQLYDFLL